MSHQPIGNHGLRIFWYGQISPWASPSRLSNVRIALVSFLSGGYNLHRFSDAIGLVIKGIQSLQTFCATALICRVNHLNKWERINLIITGRLTKKMKFHVKIVNHTKWVLQNIPTECLWSERWSVWGYVGVESAQSSNVIFLDQIIVK